VPVLRLRGEFRAEEEVEVQVVGRVPLQVPQVRRLVQVPGGPDGAEEELPNENTKRHAIELVACGKVWNIEDR